MIGSGTVLDTARLRYLLGEHLEVCSKNVHAYIMGEHGDSSFVPWSHSYVGCKSLTHILEQRNEDISVLDKIYTDVQQAAYEIINRKKATYYGIGLGLTKIIKAILNNENEILTVSTYLDGEYNQKEIYIGVPAIINHQGVKEILQLNLADDEKAKLDNSCNVLRNMLKEIEEEI